MTGQRCADCIVTEPKPVMPRFLSDLALFNDQGKSTVEFTHLMTVDSEVIDYMFSVDSAWLWKGACEEKLDVPHVHDHDTVLAFIGSDQANPSDLCGEITLWLDNEKHVLNKTCLVYVPAGAVHFPVTINRIDKPVFFASISPAKLPGRKDASEVGPIGESPACTIITEVVEFNGAGSNPPPRPPDSDLEGARVMHLEDHVAKGSFYVDFVWIYKGTGQAPAQEHFHEWEELIAMTGSDPEHPHELGGTMSIVLDGETQYINNSSLVCIPKDLKHCPWKFHDIRKPTLVFTAGPSGTYTGSHKEEQ